MKDKIIKSDKKTVEMEMSLFCFNHCPNCDATDPDIEWGDKEWSGECAYQDAECLKCGCEFKEIYQYAHTEYKKIRVKCSYPMSLFYSFEDEIPEGTRISTPEECEKCEGMAGCEDTKFCLMHNYTHNRKEIYNPYSLYYEGQTPKEQKKAIKVSKSITAILDYLEMTACSQEDMKEAGKKIKAFEKEGVGVGDTATDECIAFEFEKRLKEKGKSEKEVDKLGRYFYDVIHR